MAAQPSIQVSNPLLTIGEMANELHVSPKTVYYWVGRFEIPFLKVGRHLRFKRDEVLQFFQERTRDRIPCLGSDRLVEPMALMGRASSPGSLKIRSGNSAET